MSYYLNDLLIFLLTCRKRQWSENSLAAHRELASDPDLPFNAPLRLVAAISEWPSAGEGRGLPEGGTGQRGHAGSACGVRLPPGGRQTRGGPRAALSFPNTLVFVFVQCPRVKGDVAFGAPQARFRLPWSVSPNA